MDLQRAKELLSGLADGVDPLTGEVLPEDHVCNKAEIIRAFHCVLKSLPGKSSKPQPENAGKPWNDADDAVLCQMFDAGGSNSGSLRDDYDNPEDLWEDNQDWYEDEDEAWDEWENG